MRRRGRAWQAEGIVYVAPTLVLALAVAFGGLACRSTDHRAELRGSLAQIVVDPERRAVLTGLLDERDRELGEFARAREQLTSEMRDLNASRDADPDDIEEAFERFEVLWSVHRDRMISTSMEMRASTTPAEWRSLAEHDIEVLLNP